MINMNHTAPRCLDPYAAPVPVQMARNSSNVIARAGANGGSVTNGSAATGAGSTVNMAGLTTQNSMTNNAMGMNGGMSLTGPAGEWSGAGSANGNWNGTNENRNGMESELGPYGNGEGDHTPEEEEGMTSIPQDDFDEPLTAGEAARNSWRALLARNIGRNVLVSFLIGTQNTVVAEGELYEVGTDYLVIYQPLWNSHISADLYAVKFVEFREPPGQTLN